MSTTTSEGDHEDVDVDALTGTADDFSPLMGVDLAMAIALYEPDQCQRCGGYDIIGFSGLCRKCIDYFRGEVPA